MLAISMRTSSWLVKVKYITFLHRAHFLNGRCAPKWGKLGKIVLLGEREGQGRTSEVQPQDRMQWLMKSIVASHGLEGNASATLDSITQLALTESWIKLHYDKSKAEPGEVLKLLEGI